MAHKESVSIIEKCPSIMLKPQTPLSRPAFLASSGTCGSWFGGLLSRRPGGAPEEHQTRGHVLVDGIADHFVLTLQVVHAVLFVRELATAASALERILLATLILEVSVQIVVPVVRALAVRTCVDALAARRVFGRGGLPLALGRPLLRRLRGLCWTTGLLPRRHRLR